MATARTYRVQLTDSKVNAQGQFCSDGKLVDTRILTASSRDALLDQIRSLVKMAGVDCRAYVQICGTKRPSSSFRDWAVTNLLHIAAA